jgi:WD40 repeat protein/tRNA A-37 threonylcarbamoyl transferase component Bud32
MIDYGNGNGSPADLRERLAAGDPIAEEDLIELFCSDQARRWRAGEHIPAEAYLSLHPTLTTDGDGAFELVYGEYLVRELLGESPKLDEFLWRFPRFAERLRRQLSLHLALADEKASLETEPRAGLQNAGDDASASFPKLPGYDVLGELGRGGMSAVYRARQAGLNRIVAVKVIQARVYADVTVAARFRDEAEAAARLRHPNIVHVYEVGEHEGQGFLVMEYVAGGSLAQNLAGTPQPPRDSAELIESLASAVYHAHEHGIVHRDLKPGNIVLTLEGVPKVTDFGLAKLVEREGGLTQTGDIMGTPSYMAPEQAQGTPSDVTPAADVYALGAILYEMLTGRPPFKGATPLSTLNQVAEYEPLAPGKLQRHIPRELETVCLKCLQKEPRKRYATALALADDLHRFLENRPILARRISFLERIERWRRREPLKAGLILALLCAFFTGVAGVATQWRRAEEKARAESYARARAERERGRALDNVYFSRIAQARLEWRLNNASGSAQLLDKCDQTRRGWEWHHLRNLSRSALFELDPTGLTYIVSVVFSPDGNRLAFSGFDPYQTGNERRPSIIEVWDTTTQTRLHAFDGPVHTMRLAFRPDGQELAASGAQETRIWDTGTGQTVRTWSPGGSVTYSPDGRLLASGNEELAIFWDVATGKEVRRFPKRGGRVTFSQDGQILAVSGPDAVDLHVVATGRRLRSLPHDAGEKVDRHERIFGGEGPDLAFSPDGTRLVVAARTPRIWDTTTGQLLHQLGGHAGTVAGVAFGPDGRQIATAGADSTIRVWDAESGAERALLRGHASLAGSVAFHPEGWCLISGGRHVGQVRIWDLTRPQESLSLRHAAAPAFVFDDSGKHLKLVTAAGRLQTREIESGANTKGAAVDLSQQWLTPADTAEFSADGLRLATASVNRLLVKVCDANSGRELTELSGLNAPATYLAISRNGKRVAAAGLYARDEVRKREVKVWDAATAVELATFIPSRAPTPFIHGRVALSPDGELVAFDDYDLSPAEPPDSLAAPQDARLRVCHVGTGRELLNLSVGASIVFCAEFSPDGKLIAAGNQDGDLFVWDSHTGEVVFEEKQSSSFFRLAFSPDGRRLAGVDREKVLMWNARDGQEVLLLRGAQPRSIDGGFNPVVAWSPDSRQLAALNWDGSISVWDASERPSPATERWREAKGRTFAWHLAEAEAAAAREDARAVSFHLAILSNKAPPDGTSLVRRGQLYMQLRHWDQASADLARWLESDEPDDDGAWLNYARVLIERGDLDGYHRLCARVLDAYEKQPHPELAWIAAYTIGLGPGPPPRAARMAELAGTKLPAQLRHPHHSFALALAHFRAMEWEPASVAIANFMKGDPASAWRAWPVLAMTEYRLGRVAESKKALELATQWREEHMSGSAGPIVPLARLDFRAHYCEAADLVAQAK